MENHDHPRPRPRRRSVVRALASLRLGIVLLALIAAASTVGVVLPQPESFDFNDYLQTRFDPSSPRAMGQGEFLRLIEAAGVFRSAGSMEQFRKDFLARKEGAAALYNDLIAQAKSRGLPDERLASFLLEVILIRGQRSGLSEAEWRAALGETLRRLRQGPELRKDAWAAFLQVAAQRLKVEERGLACLRLGYVDSYGLLLGRVMLALRLHVVFRSAWFRLLCFALVVNIVACSLQRLPAQWRAAFGLRPSKNPRWYHKRSIAAEVSVPAPRESESDVAERLREQGFAVETSAVDEAATAAAEALRQAGFRVRRRRATALATLEAHRGPLGGAGRLGSQVVHLGVVLIVIGGFISGQLGFRHRQLLGAGEVVTVPDLSFRLRASYLAHRLAETVAGWFGARWSRELTPEEKLAMAPDWRDGLRPPGGEAAFRLRLERFEVRFDDRGKPEYYGSHVTLLDTQPPTPVTIEVNRPLVHRGFHVYQTSYQPDYRQITSVTFLVARVRGGVASGPHSDSRPGEVLDQFSVVARPGEPITVPGGGLVLRIDDYFSHWQMPLERGPDGRPKAGKPRNDTRGRFNPAIRLHLEAPGTAPLERWLMLPVEGRGPRQGGTIDYAGYRVAALDFSPAYATELTFKTHPVLGPVWVGCAVMMLGIFLCFYCNHERVWALVQRTPDGGARVHLSGNSFKWQERFRERFASVVSAIEQKVAREE